MLPHFRIWYFNWQRLKTMDLRSEC